MHILEVDHLQQLFSALEKREYGLIGPTIRDQAIVFDKITTVADLPKGWTDEQRAGSYRLSKRDDDALFGFVIGPVSWKRFLFPPRVKLLSATRTGKGFQVETAPSATEQPPAKLAFIGVRSCELAAIGLHDKIFAGGHYADPSYRAIRENVCLVAVDCLAPGGNCFCASMETGPKVRSGFDLALTELICDGTHRFAIRAGSRLGEELLGEVEHRSATPSEEHTVATMTAAAAGRMGRRVVRENLSKILQENFEHQEWEDVSKRCLACANCTMVCPTCFCSTVEDTTDLTGSKAERVRRWDSCFTMDFARVAGGNMRPSARARYRQWVMHKFAFWEEQFGQAGCVGCGRCISWCPVGIDITDEVYVIAGPKQTKR